MTAASRAKSRDPLVEAIRGDIKPVTGEGTDYDALLDAIGAASIVCIGEASHGTHEFYRERAKITKRLIAERGFTAVAVEADWPDAYRVNRYVRNQSDDRTAIESLDGFKSRFPTWMWRNADVLDFIGWLRSFNDTVREKAGFYGIDLYSLFSSMQAVIRYLEDVDPAAAKRAKERYSCFDHFGEEAQSYGYATAFGAAESCQEEVVKQLTELRQAAVRYSEELFSAEQNARWSRMPRSTTGRCSPGACRHGTCVIGTWPRRWTRWSSVCTPRSSSGPTTPTSATRVSRRCRSRAS